MVKRIVRAFRAALLKRKSSVCIQTASNDLPRKIGTKVQRDFSVFGLVLLRPDANSRLLPKLRVKLDFLSLADDCGHPCRAPVPFILRIFLLNFFRPFLGAISARQNVLLLECPRALTGFRSFEHSQGERVRGRRGDKGYSVNRTRNTENNRNLLNDCLDC